MWLILLLTSIIWTSNKCYAEKSPESLRTEEGLMMNSFMNKSTNPCDDFYEYACGNWAKNQIIDKSDISFEVHGVVTRKVDKFLEEAILFNNYSSATSGKVQKILKSSEVKKVQRYFSICREQKKSECKPYIEEWGVPGGWPISNSSWSNQTFDWLNITGHLKLVGSESLIDVYVGPHHKDATRNTIYILPAEFPLFKPVTFEENPIVKVVLTKLMLLHFKPFGLDKATLNKTISDILAFESKLANIFPEDSDSADMDEIKDMTLETLQELIPDMDFQKLVNIVSNEVFNRSQEVTIAYPSYFTNLLKLLQETESKVLANFFSYRFCLQIGTTETVEVYCRDEAIKEMGFVLGYIYNTAFNDERTNEDVRAIAQNIKSVFANTVKQVDWMDPDTKKEALSKLDNLLLKVGASNNNTFFDNIKEEFSLINLDPDNYYRSYFNLMAYSNRKLFRTLNKTNERSDSNYNAAMVNAFNDMSKNFILVPPNILQGPIYEFHFPYSVKYGGLGSVVGHEITHSMDGTGRIFDSKGTVREWWTKKSEEEYLNRTKCLQAQYANYTPSSQNSSANTIGESTLDENIADNGGIRLSYQAYKDWYAKNSDEQETLPHLNLTNTQLFFLSFAQFYCEMAKPGAVLVSMLTDEHSLSKNRVIGTLSNFEEFSKEFNCPAGSRMNPTKKCRVW
ncbi:unnamed protein product [Hermetia illucens]|uniref:Uncharacterized protein n=1 Tax=Hermetia illucens TaxID=343691 RepID=A0A7R8YUG6_HERIL|nr:neprilysin-4-like [Hermetia illucens]CAD7084706.1 unnamed protein product [Hermetia illucens]